MILQVNNSFNELPRQVFAIGDVQGCYDSFTQLIDKMRQFVVLGPKEYDSEKDKIVLLGDIVNRGPKSLEMLKYVYDNQDKIKIILGNHDLHLISCYDGFAKNKINETLRPILKHKNCDKWIKWLRNQSILYYDYGCIFVHAGIWPEWTVEQAILKAKKVERAIQRPQTFKAIWGKHLPTPSSAKDCKTKLDRMRFSVKCFTTMRYIDSKGHLVHAPEVPPKAAPKSISPWHKLPSPIKEKIYYGHWAAQGLSISPKRVGLDSGCVWGKSLSAIRLQDHRIISISSRE